MFNTRLKGVVDQLNNELPDAKLIYINSYGIFQDVISNPSAYGNLISFLNIFIL
jgi:phospholipase/lecithinase/hemolysin